MSTVAYLLGFLAAASNAASNTLQRAANRAERNQQVEFSLQLIGTCCTSRCGSPAWAP